ncbi:unnamed protein product [Musa acuminata subsp. burmannicoides]
MQTLIYLFVFIVDSGSLGSFLSDRTAKVFVAGYRGLVGSAVHRKLVSLGFTDLLPRTHAELDLTCQSDVKGLFAAELPSYVIVEAAKVGGIHANDTFRPTSSPPTSRSRPTSSTPPSAPAAAPSASSPSSAPPASTPSIRPSRYRIRPCSPAPSSPPTSGTRWPRSPALRCARRTGSSTASTPSGQCRPASTVPTTTSTRRTPTCSRRCSVVSTKPRPREQSRWWFGA